MGTEPKKVGARPKRRDLSLQLAGKATFRQVGLPDVGGELELSSVDQPPMIRLPGVAGQ